MKALKASARSRNRPARQASSSKLVTVTYRVDDFERKAIVRYALALSNKQGSRVSQNTAMRKVLRDLGESAKGHGRRNG